MDFFGHLQEPTQRRVRRLDEGYGLFGEAPPVLGHGEAFHARVGQVGGTGEQTSSFQGAQNLAGHHDVGFGVCGGLALAWQPIG